MFLLDTLELITRSAAAVTSFLSMGMLKRKNWEYACCKSEEFSSFAAGQDWDRTLNLVLCAVVAQGLDYMHHSLSNSLGV